MLYVSATRNFCSKSILTSSLIHSRRFYFPSSSLPLAKWQVSGAQTTRTSVLKAIGAVGLGLGISIFSRPSIQCEASRPASPAPVAPAPAPPSPTPDAEMPPLPASSVNVYELTFGTVAGICAGVFIKKGVKTAAFLLGGVFVLLQYFGSFGVLKVNWESVGNRFQRLFYTTDPQTGNRTAPTVYSAWKWLVDFLTADFQPRASFIAGLALGLRIG
ncbi:FUN14 family-domain-containing protein [Mycena sanguinolenta]|nr:FUN14 family-domain-containing protein [Mycena sanguinolenta]